MVYVRVDVVDEEGSLREQAEAALEEASWSPEQWHHSHRGKIALKRGVKEIRRQLQAQADGTVTPVRRRRDLNRPSALVSPSALRSPPTESSDGAAASSAPAHLEVRRCTRRLRDALRDMGRCGHASEAGGQEDMLQHQLVRGIAALAIAPDDRTHKHIEVILRLVRSAGFQVKSHPQMQKLCRIAKHVAMSTGSVVCRQGDVNCDIYIVLRGSLSVTIDGKEMSVLRSGSYFGELGLLNGAYTRTATVTCTGDSFGQTHLVRFAANDLNATPVDLDLMFGHAKHHYRDHNLAGLKRLEMRLSAAMAHDPPPPEAYASHRELIRDRKSVV